MIISGGPRIVKHGWIRYHLIVPAFNLFQKKWVLIVLLSILFFLVLGLNTRVSEFFRLTGQRNEMEQRIDSLEATSTALETELAYANSDKAVEEWGRTFEKMGKEGDKLVVPLPSDDATPESSFLPTPVPDVHENWEIWWELIFGD